MPLTSLTTAMRDRLLDASQRSSASVSARRTRLSSNGLWSWFMATIIAQSHALSCTVILLPSACTSVSRSDGLKPRNWMCARSPRMAATWAALELMKIAR